MGEETPNRLKPKNARRPVRRTASREQEVARVVADGLSNKAIAAWFAGHHEPRPATTSGRKPYYPCPYGRCRRSGREPSR